MSPILKTQIVVPWLGDFERKKNSKAYKILVEMTTGKYELGILRTPNKQEREWKKYGGAKRDGGKKGERGGGKESQEPPKLINNCSLSFLFSSNPSIFYAFVHPLFIRPT